MINIHLKKVSIFMMIFLIIISSINITGKIIKEEIKTTASSGDDDIDWWPMFHHDLNHTGYSTSTGPETNNVLWGFQADARIYKSSPAVVDNMVYFGDESNSFYCLDSVTGEEIWKTTIPFGIAVSSPAVENGKVYFGAGNGNGGVYCLNATNGDILWRYQTPGDNIVFASPAVYEGKVFVGAPNPDPGRMYCLDADTGGEIWISQTIDRPNSAAVYDDRVYFGSYDSNVYCLDADNGTVIWKYNITGKYIEVTISDDKLYAGCIDGLYCLNIEDGSLIWKYPTHGIYSTPCAANGFVYFATSDGYVYCLNATSGEKIWDFDIYGVSSCSPAYADGKIYISPKSRDAKLYCLDADSGEKIWDFTTVSGVDSSPAIADGKLYIGLRITGEFLCFGGESDNKPPITPKEIFGPTSGKLYVEYTYNTSTYDPDGDQLYYLWDWYGGTSNWLGPYESNETAEYKITYEEYGYYEIKVIVQDSHHARSWWARLLVTVPRDKTITSSPLLRFLERYPLLNRLLDLIK